MDDLFLERLVKTESEEDIDNLKPRDVINVKNNFPRVFDRREGDMMIFYFPDYLDFLEKNVIIELKTPRDYLSIGNDGIHFILTALNKKRELTYEDGDYYKERKDDLIKLGLMK